MIYARVSLDRTGEGAAVARQLDDARDLAKRRGWTVIAEHTDNDTSAAGSKHRPGFDAALDDLAAGRASVLIAWAVDRVTRNRRDTVRLIETCQAVGATIAAVRGADLDLSTPSGRLVADVLASVARSEIEVKGDRQRRANEQAAAAGKPPAGPRAFGYEPGGMTLRADEARLMREAYATVLDGGSLKSIARAWNAAGARTPRGNAWGASEVRRALLKPRNAALRVHRGVVVGPGAWEPVIDVDTHTAAVHLLTDPARSTTTDRSIKFLLTRIAECGRCDDGTSVSTARTQHGARTYKCHERGDLSRAAEPIDAFVERVILERLARPDAADLLAPDPVHDVDALRREAAVLRARLDEAASLFAAGSITAAQLATITRDVEGRLSRVEAELTAAARTNPVAGLVGADDVEAVWERLDVLRRRAVVRALFARVVLEPVPQGARRFRPESVRLVWRG